MRIAFFLLISFLLSNTLIAQNKLPKEYSYTELFELIEKEKDSIFSLSDAIIYFDNKTDSLYKYNTEVKNNNTYSKTIRPIINLKNILFDRKGQISYKTFISKVDLYNCSNLNFNNSIFKKEISITQRKTTDDFEMTIYLKNNQFNGLDIVIGNEVTNSFIAINDNTFSNHPKRDNTYSTDSFYFNPNGGLLSFTNNNIKKDINLEFIGFKNSTIDIYDNDLKKAKKININDGKIFLDNELPLFSKIYFGDKGQYNYEIIKNRIAPINFFGRPSMFMIKNTSNYKEYIKNLNQLLLNYKAQRDLEAQNGVYNQIKKIETKRFEYIYKKNKNFDNFFQWQINKFLGAFSNYGTKPSKAITTSVYVILLFAFFYFLFPNEWDSNGKNRLMNRYSFFLKYLNLDSGMHDIYMSENKEKLLEFNDFKKVLENSKHSIPKFFTTTALPLYRWSILGTKFTSNALKSIDILKGSWQDVPKNNRWWKGLLITLAFIIAVLFDIFIKFLNSLMLSINTFSTLGFGDIPIKGFPRYLAIIEGFIGWFMLTIFSVSLISQLLN